MEVQLMRVFDNLVSNEDRNQGNILYDANWNLWMIDHTRSFRKYDDLLNAQLIRACERGVWEQLNQVEDETIENTLAPFLSHAQIKTLLKRRQKLVAHLRGLIDEQGEGNVLFTLWPRDEFEHEFTFCMR